jgi:phosphoribosylformylglycinamidine synthase
VLVTLAESAFPRGLGFDVKSTAGIRQDAMWFGEAQSRVIVSVAPAKQAAFEAHLAGLGVKSTQIGTVKGTDMVVDGQVVSSLAKASGSYFTALETALTK